MSNDRDARNSRRDGRGLLGTRRLAGAMVLCLCASGCMKPLQEHSVALAAATAPVVDEATAAYHAANAIHDLRVDYDATLEFDKTDVAYNPRKIQPLLSEKDMDTRLAVLKALQCYVKDLVAITGGTDSKELDAASTSLGNSLSSLGDTFLPAGTSSTTATITTDGRSEVRTTTVAANAISSEEQKGISVAMNALGQFLVSRKISKELPGLIVSMDPHVKTLCEFLSKDIDVLRSQETIDFNFMINNQTQFLMDHKTMDPEARQRLIVKLPEMVRKQRATDEQLSDLKAGLIKLNLTHHAFAAEAQGNNPASIGMKIGELSAAGENLGKFYASLGSSK